MKIKSTNNSIYDITIRMFILFLIIAWCLLIMLPFVHIMLWGLILALAFMPVHNSLTKFLGGKSKVASILIVLVSLVIVIIPSWLFLDSIVEGVKELRLDYQAGTLTIPPPSEKVKSWPLIGQKAYDIWLAGSLDLEQFIVNYKEQLGGIAKKLASGVLGATSGVFQMIGAIIIAGILLLGSNNGENIRKFFRKVAGDRGDHFADVVKLTVGNVMKSVLGIALFQAFLCGIGFMLADIPFAGLWALLVLVLSILQISPSLVTITIAIYMFSVKEPLPALLWTIYLISAGISDNFLKPIFLGKGAPVPMLIIFIGVVGGFMFSGFIGLFTGAVVMSIGYKLYIGWINSGTEKEEVA